MCLSLRKLSLRSWLSDIKLLFTVRLTSEKFFFKMSEYVTAFEGIFLQCHVVSATARLLPVILSRKWVAIEYL